MSSAPSSVLITGANRGIGFEIVKHLLAQVHPPSVIFATYRNPHSAKDLLQLAVEKKSIRPLQFDVCTGASANSALLDCVSSVVGDRGLNVLINNAGVYVRREASEQTTREELMTTYEVNAVGPLLLTQALLPLLKLAAKSDAGTPFTWTRSAIFNISSVLGSIASTTSVAGHYSYRMSKAAMNMSTKAMSIDLKASGILVVSLHPGWVRTDMGTSRAALSVEESVGPMVNTMRSLTEKDNGGFFKYTGEELPY